jgi:homoserine kinase type II
MAVYTDVTAEDLNALLERYDIGGLTAFKGIAEGVENSNYLLATQSAQYILTLYEKRVDEGDLPFFLGLMEYLADRGLPCPRPVRDLGGHVLQMVAERPAAIVTFLQGYSIRKPTPAHCEAVGASLGQFHRDAEGFAIRRPNGLSLKGWRLLMDAIGARSDLFKAGLGRKLEHAYADLERAWPSGLPAGVIHADLFPNNVFFLGNRISGLIDFYFACNDLLAYDLAICMNAWCFEIDHAFNVTKAKALLKGYTAVRPMTGPEIEALPCLAQGAALRFLLTRLYDWFETPETALVKRLDPNEYLRKLEFHQSVRSAGEYGI